VILGVQTNVKPMIDSPSGERFFPRFPLSRVWVANLQHQFTKLQLNTNFIKIPPLVDN
jgi:hypothetical protein